jgi:AAHS family 4-hydroxybenzoate transporter-like MFS transporter
VGSVLGPLVGGYVLSTALPVKNTYALLAVCPAIYGACVLTIGLIERRDRIHANQAEASPPPVAAEA